MKRKPEFETRAIQSTHHLSEKTTPVSTPIFLSSTYKRNENGSYNDDLVYSRNDNPNRFIVENSIAQLENASFGVAYSSGMAAISAVFQTLKSGDHILLPDDIYYAIKKLLDKVLRNVSIHFTLVDMSDLQAVEQAIKSTTKLIWIETPSNPQLKITDIEKIVAIAKQHGILTVADNTWATPVFQNPLNLGVDIVMHSATKYFGGHSDVVGGCLVTNEAHIHEKLKNIQVLSGAVPSPFDCWLIARGIQTLALRMEKQTQNAFELAQFLESHPKVLKVHYPGLVSHKGHEIAKKQQSGFGAMMAVLIDGDEKTTQQLTTKLDYFITATSLGGVESLVEHRKSVEGPDSPTPPNLIRISVGIENIKDLIHDWRNALETI